MMLFVHFLSVIWMLSIAALAQDAQLHKVGVALRSESVVLVQLGNWKEINFTTTHHADQEYRDFMTLMRHEQLDLPLFQELLLTRDGRSPIYGKSSGLFDPPSTALHYTNILTRNLRPVVREASRALGGPVKCEIIGTPDYGRLRFDYRMLVRLASEMAQCGHTGIAQITYLQKSIFKAYELDLVNGKRYYTGPGLGTTRMTLVIEIEPSHVRIAAYDMTPRGVMSGNCALVCEVTVSDPAIALSKCLSRYRDKCITYSIINGSIIDHPQVQGQYLQNIFLSGSIGQKQKEIEGILRSNFGHGIVDDMTFGIDPEILGAFGAAFDACLTEIYPELRDEYHWNDPVLKTLNPELVQYVNESYEIV